MGSSLYIDGLQAFFDQWAMETFQQVPLKGKIMFTLSKSSRLPISRSSCLLTRATLRGSACDETPQARRPTISGIKRDAPLNSTAIVSYALVAQHGGAHAMVVLIRRAHHAHGRVSSARGLMLPRLHTCKVTQSGHVDWKTERFRNHLTGCAI